MVFWLTVIIGTEGVNVGVMVGVSVGSGVSAGARVSVAVGGLVVRASSVAVAAAAASSNGSDGVWEGKLQADIPKIMMQPTIKIFLVMFMARSRIG